MAVADAEGPLWFAVLEGGVRLSIDSIAEILLLPIAEGWDR